MDRRCMLDLAFECTSQGCSPWVVDALPEIAFQWIHSMDRRSMPDVTFIVVALPDIASERILRMDS